MSGRSILVALVHLPVLKQVAQGPLHVRPAGQQQQPGGGHVQPVHAQGIAVQRLHA
jgi:hypothetical protein